MRLAIILALSVSLAAQTTLYLRNASSGVAVNITALSVGTPPTLSAAGHGFLAGDRLWCDGARPTTSPLNGQVKVKTADANTFTLTDVNDADLAVPSGTSIVLSGFRDRMKCGKVSAYALKDHPRGMFDGPGGTHTTRLTDPDGAGATKAPNASDANFPPQIAARYVGDAQNYRRLANNTAAGQFSYAPVVAAAWYADRSLSSYRTALLDWLSDPAKLVNGSYGYGCPTYIEGCGRGSSPEYNSWQTNYIAHAYTLFQTELDASQKARVANALFNGWNGEACANQFQLQAGRISVTNGSNVVTGVGTSFTSLAVNQYISIPTGTKSGWFPKIIAINSDTSITVSSSSWFTASNMEWGAFVAWVDGMCGQLWFAGSHGATPKTGFALDSMSVQISGTISSITQTSIQVANAAPFSGLSLPFYVYISDLINPADGKYVNPFEVMKVTAIDGNTLTVERGAFNSPKGTGGLNKYLSYSTKAPLAGNDTTLNLNWSDVFGAGYAGFILAGDDARARNAAEWGWNTFYDRYWPLVKDDWSAMTSGGLGNSYGGPRYERWMSMMMLAARNSLTPSLTLGGDELTLWKNMLAGWPYHVMPSSYLSIQINDSGPDQGIASRYTSIVPIALGFGLADSDEFKWAYYWFRQQNGFYARPELAGASGMDNLIFAYLFDEPSRACPGPDCVDYRTTAPLTRFETDAIADTDSKNYGLVTSRSGWGTADTMIWSTAIGSGQDHVGAYQAPGDYRIYKSGLLLGSGGWGPGSFGYASETGYSNYVEIAGANAVTGGGGARVDRKTGSETWGAYWRTDTKPGYLASLNVQRAYRHILHLRSTSPDYIVVYDDVATAASSLKRARLNFMSPKSAAINLTRNGNVFTATHSASRLNTHVLIPSDQAATTLASAPKCNNVYGTYPCQWNSQAARMETTGASAEFLVVHSPSSSTTATMPTTSLLTSGSNSYALQIEDQNTPIVAVISREQDPTALAWTSTHGATAEITIAGLAISTNYAILRDGATVGTFGSGTGGVIHLTGIAGSYTASASGSSLSILTTSLPSGSIGTAYSRTLVGSGGTPPYTWTVQSGTLPAGLSLVGDTVSGTPTTAATSNFTVRLTDSAAGTVDQALSIAVAGNVEITTTSLAQGVVGTAYSQTLQRAGGTAPFTWSVVEGALPPGLTLNSSSGAITGTPTTAGSSYAFTARITAVGSSDDQPLSIEIRAPGLSITTTAIPAGTAGVAYLQGLSAQSGSPPYTWSRTGGTCPAGLELSGAGLLTWSEPTAVTCTVAVAVTDQASGSAARTYSLTIAEAPVSGNPTPVVKLLKVVGEWARIGYGYPGLRASVVCAIATPTGNLSDTGGGAWRHATVRLVADTADQLVEVTCLDATGSVTISTGSALSGTGTISVKLGPGSYTHAAMDTSDNRSTWATGSEVACQTGCTLTSKSLAKGAYWYRVRRRSNGADRVTSGPQQAVVQ